MVALIRLSIEVRIRIRAVPEVSYLSLMRPLCQIVRVRRRVTVGACDPSLDDIRGVRDFPQMDRARWTR